MQLSGPQQANYALKGPNADRMTSCDFALLYYGSAVPRVTFYKKASNHTNQAANVVLDSEDEMHELSEECESSQRIIGSNLYERYLNRDIKLKKFSLYDYVM